MEVVDQGEVPGVGRRDFLSSELASAPGTQLPLRGQTDVVGRDLHPLLVPLALDDEGRRYVGAAHGEVPTKVPPRRSLLAHPVVGDGEDSSSVFLGRSLGVAEAGGRLDSLGVWTLKSNVVSVGVLERG